MDKGKFITFEGIDGAGKSTQIHELKSFLQKRDIHAILTREPGGTPFAEQLRELVLHTKEPLTADAEALLMFSARAQHLSSVVLPALNSGKTVICSRFSDATVAYQGYGRGMDKNRIEMLIDWTHSSCQPDLTIILDLPLEIAISRLEKRGEQSDRFEREKNDFMSSVRNGYLEIANQHPERCKVVDSTQSINDISAEISEHASSLF